VTPAWAEVFTLLGLGQRWLWLSVLVLVIFWLVRQVAALDGRMATWPWWVPLLIGGLLPVGGPFRERRRPWSARAVHVSSCKPMSEKEDEMSMPHDAIAAANAERLQGWAHRLTEAEATAVVLVGIGQGATNGGTIHIIVPEHDLFDRVMIRALLREALADLERRQQEVP